MVARRPPAVRVPITGAARRRIAVQVPITVPEPTAGQRLPMIVAPMDVPLRPMEAGVTTAGPCHRMAVVRTRVPCHPTVVAQPTAAVEGCRPTAVAAVAVAGPMAEEVGDTPPGAAVDTAAAVVVAAVDTAVAVDTEVATSETLHCVVLTPSDFWTAFLLFNRRSVPTPMREEYGN